MTILTYEEIDELGDGLIRQYLETDAENCFCVDIEGFVTDFLGLLLLLPPVQKHLTMKLLPHLRFSRMPGGGFSAGTGGGETFDGEFQRKDDKRDSIEHKDDRRD